MTKRTPDLSQENYTISKSGEGRVRVALAFPNTYYVGMSNLGFQVLYRIFNHSPDVFCERVFLPDIKTSRHLINTGKPLRSFESDQPLTSFHVIAFSLSFENDYLNIISMLSLAKIPVLQSDRPPFSPMIIGGGIAVMLNPEPLAEIFDLFIIGEAEEVMEQFLDVLRQGSSMKGREKPELTRFADIEGVYVPSAYEITYNNSGLIQERCAREGFPQIIKARQVADLNLFPSSSCISTPNTEFADMKLIEASRGCPRRCRFCAVGRIYQPFRIRKLLNLLKEIQPLLNEQTRIGILGAAVSDYPDLPDLLKALSAQGVEVSVSSLRADSLTEEIVSLLKESGLKTFTIAPEAGSERLRQVIGKALSSDEIFRAVKIFSRCRVPNIKLYFMIGLPTESDEDIKAIVNLAKEIKHIYYKEAKLEKWLSRITLSISPFVPKAFTPFQWHPFDQVGSLKHKLKIISNGLKKERKITVNYDLPKWRYIQTLLSRGDRRVAKLILKAFEKKGDWTSALREADLNSDFYVYRARSSNEILPWDFIDHGIDKKKLWQEYKKVFN